MTAADNRLKLEEAEIGNGQPGTGERAEGRWWLADRPTLPLKFSSCRKAGRPANTDAGGVHFCLKGDPKSQGRYEYRATASLAQLHRGQRKALFVDVPAAKNTFTTQLNPLNKGTLAPSPTKKNTASSTPTT